ncbi:hypothetical protein [Parvularcula sp. IMCC14364]|uniref:hypothetical protein n=1 Tax=Parvularcula sp. IMCC14364 TaxID=3067902 RepID=UPI002741FCC3|nr:hypothetical protein [Parvularcula sp. IMCC14364]
MRDFDGQLKRREQPVFDVADYADLDLDTTAWTLQAEDAQRLANRRHSDRA